MLTYIISYVVSIDNNQHTHSIIIIYNDMDYADYTYSWPWSIVYSSIPIIMAFVQHCIIVRHIGSFLSLCISLFLLYMIKLQLAFFDFPILSAFIWSPFVCINFAIYCSALNFDEYMCLCIRIAFVHNAYA